MKRPTILQIVPELDTGGAELSAVEIGEAIVRASGRSLIATEGGRLVGIAESQGSEVLHFPAATKNPWRLAMNVRRLENIVRSENVDLIHGRSRAPAWSALWAARRLNRPFVTTYHGAYSERGALKRLYNSVMARGDRVIANSHFTAQLIQDRYQISQDRVRVIHRGVDRSFARGRVDAARITKLRQRWGIAENARIVLLAARLTDWKGQQVLISAATKLAQEQQLSDTVVVLAGDDQGRQAYKAQLAGQISAGNLNEHVRLVGHESDMAAAFAAAFVTVVASTKPEAFGRSATEAQALGCPVIATRLGAPQETVLSPPACSAEAMTGWLVAPGNVEELAERLKEALELTPEQRDAIGRRAAHHVHEGFSLEQMKFKTLCVYDELLGSDTAARFSHTPAPVFFTGQA